MSPGLFGKHVGFAPKFKNSPDYEKSLKDNIEFEGLGQMGTVMGQYMFNKMRENKGIQEANKPGYSQKLWDDRGSAIKAPDFKAIANLALTIATLPAGGAGGIASTLLTSAATAGINFAMNAGFTVLDIVNEDVTIEQGFLQMGKDFIKAGARIGMQALPGVNSGSKIFDKMADSVINQVVNNAIGGTLDSVQLSHDGQWSFNADVLKERMIGQNALAGYLSGAVAAGVNAGMGEWNLKTNLGQYEGGSNFGNIGKLNGIAGSLA